MVTEEEVKRKFLPCFICNKVYFKFSIMFSNDFTRGLNVRCDCNRKYFPRGKRAHLFSAASSTFSEPKWPKLLYFWNTHITRRQIL